jgi:AcrR family transcriptional regulator
LSRQGTFAIITFVIEIPKRPYRRAEETRRHVLDVAGRLFYTEGLHAVGIDRIAAEAQVTTTTLYRLFGSKDGLIAAYLQHADQDWFAKLETAISEGGLVHFFEVLDEEARQTANRGCVFRMAMTEYPDGRCDVHCLALENKTRTRARFREVLEAGGYANPDAKADQLMLILDGIEASAGERGPDSPPGPGPALVREILGVPA